MKTVSDIENVHSVSDLGALVRRKRLKSEFKTIAKSTLEEALKEGWEIQRENKTSYRVTREKKKSCLMQNEINPFNSCTNNMIASDVTLN